MDENQENHYDLRNNNDENINVLIDYLNEIHPKYMKGTTEVRYNYNPEPQDKKAVERFAIYDIHLENLSFDKIMNEFQRQDENKHLTESRKNEIQLILTGYLNKKQREKRDDERKQKESLGKRKRSPSKGGKKSKRKNIKKRSTKKNKK